MNLPLKYRPATFEQVVGQVHIVRTLQNALKLKKIAHAYLFAGQRGVGKTTLARIFAKGLNCVKGPTPYPCGKCEICREIEEGRSMDVIEIDGASNRGIDQIRELRENIRFLPVKARYRVIIIDEVHMLTTEAFNALLKTLEEPPENVVFIFATTEPNRIPKTVLSRVQRFDFKPLTEEEVVNRLRYICNKEGFECENSALSLIYQVSEGSMRDAIALLEQAAIFGDGKVAEDVIREMLGVIREEVYRQLFEAFLNTDSASALNLLDQTLKQGFSLFDFYAGLVKALHKLTRAYFTKEENEFKELASRFIPQDLLFLHKIVKDMEQVLKLSNYPRALFEFELLKMVHMKGVVPLKTLAIEEMTPKLEEAKQRSSVVNMLIKELKLKEVENGLFEDAQ